MNNKKIIFFKKMKVLLLVISAVTVTGCSKPVATTANTEIESNSNTKKAFGNISCNMAQWNKKSSSNEQAVSYKHIGMGYENFTVDVKVKEENSKIPEDVLLEAMEYEVCGAYPETTSEGVEKYGDYIWKVYKQSATTIDSAEYSRSSYIIVLGKTAISFEFQYPSTVKAIGEIEKVLGSVKSEEAQKNKVEETQTKGTATLKKQNIGGVNVYLTPQWVFQSENNYKHATLEIVGTFEQKEKGIVESYNKDIEVQFGKAKDNETIGNWTVRKYYQSAELEADMFFYQAVNGDNIETIRFVGTGLDQSKTLLTAIATTIIQ